MSVTDLATTYWVDGVHGNDGNSGTSSSQAWQTLGKAASMVQAGNVVTVRSGPYTAASGGTILAITRSGTPGNLIVFRSETPYGAVLDGQNNTAATGVDIRGSYIRIEGFEIKGMSHDGVNIYGSAGTTLLGIEIAQNNIHDVGRLCRAEDYDLGGSGLSAFSLNTASVLIERNKIHDIGRFEPGEQGCTLPPDDKRYQNQDHGIYIDHGVQSTIIRNNQFYMIRHGWAIHRYESGTSTAADFISIVNNTFADPNPWRAGQIIVARPMTHSTIANNIFYLPTTAAIQFDGTEGVWAHSLAVTNNVMTGQDFYYNGSPPTGVTYSGNKPNSDAQALFTNPGARDYTLKAGTNPAVDAGVTLSNVTDDYLGAVRPQGAAYDAGAYERDGIVQPPPPSTYWVDGVNGNDANSGTTSSQAWRTLGKAASMVQAGNIVTVRSGAYTAVPGGEILRITASGTQGNLIVFRSETPYGAVLDGQNNTAATGVAIRGSYIRIEGFEIKGMSHNALDIYGATGTILRGVEVAQNHVHDVGRLCDASAYGLGTSSLSAFSLDSASVLIERNTIHDIGRFAPGEQQGCTPPDGQYQNTDHGIYIDHGVESTIIRNNQFYKIQRGWPIFRYESGGGGTAAVDLIFIVNNTFADPNPWREGQIYVGGTMTHSTIANNIFYLPNTAAIRFTGVFAHSLAVTNNVMTGLDTLYYPDHTGGVTYSGNKPNSDAQALFTNPGARDYTLKAGTNPAVDAGVTLSNVLDDFLGVQRPRGAAYDAGAYER